MQVTEDDRRVEQAKESLMARVDELGRRFKEAREKLDIKSHIEAHPLIAVGAALALGALIGIPGGGRRSTPAGMPECRRRPRRRRRAPRQRRRGARRRARTSAARRRGGR